MTSWLGKLMGVEDLQSINQFDVRFAAPWAQGRPVLVLFIALGLAAIGIIFYFRYQRSFGEAQTGGRARTALAITRSILLAAIVIILAEPVISMSVNERPRPLLVWLFDGTDSFNMKDPLTGDELTKIATALKDKDDKVEGGLENASRLDLARKAVARSDDLYLGEKSDAYRLRAYVMDRLDQVREIELDENKSGDGIDTKKLADELQANGEVTALGTAIEDLTRRHKSNLLAGVVVVSDFDQNAGAAALPAAERLGAPIYTVGIGPREVVDLSVDLQAPFVLKKDEDTTVTVHLRQSGLTGQTGRVQLLARRLGSAGGGDAETAAKSVAPAKTIEINDTRLSVDIPFTPTETGRFMLQVKVDPFDGEVLEDNNVAQREITVRDESLKLFFVEYEPTWEWRFVKEVFHRDPLIGREGFRTFLRSADFKVRRTNDLFVESLVRPRSEFFANDVIFLSDVPAEMLSDNFQDMVQEYVQKFGGGLVVIGGSRFSASTLARTKIGDMLPVVLDESLRPRNGKFHMQFTPQAAEFDFMNLGDSEPENRRAWENLDPLGWYQPVVRPHPLATVLASIPSERCVDDETPQPVIAVRRYGKGEVVYLGVNEFWRLRRKYGEKYYRQFWGQLIYRLGLSRALGAQKRFQVYTDRQTYQVGDEVRVTVEAYDENFEPLDVTELSARMLADTTSGDDADVQAFTLPVARDNVVFEATVPVYSPGAHRILVRDPVTSEEYEINFTVAALAVERRNAVRDFALQEALASQTGGKSYELYQLASLAGDLKVPKIVETTEHRFPLWNTWLVLLLVLVLMLSEWLGRKLVNLR
jgi:hypothetical protein